MKQVYLDSASTTYINNQVLAEMMPALTSSFGNPNNLHSFGREAMGLVDLSRDRIAKAINAKSSEIYFTSGGTEADNWAIKGLARANKSKGKHIITSKIEHHAILESCKELEKEGFEVTYLPVDNYGLVKLDALMHEMRNDTILVSIMFANNEVGTIQNINAIAKTVHEKPNAIFHTDAVQALGAININVQDLGIDAMSISSHKVYGPKGAGALYVKSGIEIEPIIVGGNQEHNKRGGTQNVASIVGFGKAVELATQDIVTNSKRLRNLRDYFTKSVMEKIEHVHLIGHPVQRLNSIVNLSFEFVDNESVMLMLDLAGICVSTGSACTAGSQEPSHVLKAMNIEPELLKTSVRFSFAKNVTKEDVDYCVEELVRIVKKLRDISPLSRSVKEDK